MSNHTFLWHLSQSQNKGFDTFDSCVVAADTEEEAKQITPDGQPFRSTSNITRSISRWARSPEDVVAKKIGVAKAEDRGTVIITSYNAG